MGLVYAGTIINGRRRRTQLEDVIRNLREEWKTWPIEDYKEVGERLLQWAKTRTEPIDALPSYMGTEWKLAQEIKRIDKRRDPSPYRAPAKGEVSQGAQT